MEALQAQVAEAEGARERAEAATLALIPLDLQLSTMRRRLADEADRHAELQASPFAVTCLHLLSSACTCFILCFRAALDCSLASSIAHTLASFNCTYTGLGATADETFVWWLAVPRCVSNGCRPAFAIRAFHQHISACCFLEVPAAQSGLGQERRVQADHHDLLRVHAEAKADLTSLRAQHAQLQADHVRANERGKMQVCPPSPTSLALLSCSLAVSACCPGAVSLV